MSNKCFNEKINSYEQYMKKRDFHNNRVFLENYKCCDVNSCNELVNEYDKLIDKCHDIFGSTGLVDVDEKGRVIGDSICSILEEKKQSIKNTFNGGNKRNNRAKTNKTNKTNKMYKTNNNKINKTNKKVKSRKNK